MSALIVEDNPDVAQVLADILASFGWEARIAPTPVAALLALRQKIPVLILLDFDLPGANGVEVLRYIKSDPLARDVEVVFVSAEDSPDTIGHALASGARDYLVKPVDIDRLGEVLGSLPAAHVQPSEESKGTATAKKRKKTGARKRRK
jgi:CheY-like chemotaxis protein